MLLSLGAGFRLRVQGVNPGLGGAVGGLRARQDRHGQQVVLGLGHPPGVGLLGERDAGGSDGPVEDLGVLQGDVPFGQGFGGGRQPIDEAAGGAHQRRRVPVVEAAHVGQPADCRPAAEPGGFAAAVGGLQLAQQLALDLVTHPQEDLDSARDHNDGDQAQVLRSPGTYTGGQLRQLLVEGTIGRPMSCDVTGALKHMFDYIA